MTVSISGTSGIVNDATDLNYTGTLTGGTGVVNLGSGQVYKDASGNVGIGGAPSAWNNAYKPIQFNTVAPGNIGSAADEFVLSSNAYNNSGWKYQSTGYLASYYMQTGGTHRWFSAASGTAGNAVTWTESARIDSSGNLLVGTTATGAYQDGRVNVISTSSSPSACFKSILSTQATMFVWNSADSGTRKFAGFVVSSSPAEVGTITSTGSSTAYNTTSDYRLKEAIAPMTGALAKIAALKPVTYKWKVDGSDGQGFIAHELAEVEAGCVTGAKDAVDEEGNPQYQGIDTSFLVATLAAAIQELKAIVDAQATRITALEGAAA